MPAPKSIRSRTSGTIRVPWRNALAIAFASSLLAVGSNAATLTWTGLAGDNKISTAGNWTPSQAPVSGVALVFSGTVGLLPNLGAAGLSVSGLTFSAGSGAFTLTGPGAYAINTGGITDSAASLETIANGISLAGAQTWASTGGNLLFDGATINLGAQTLTLATGTHAITISNAISGTGKLIENGTGALTLTGSSTFSGGVTLSSGTAILGNGAALGSGALTLGGGSINVTNGSQTLANAVSFAANTTFVGSGGNLTLTGTAALTGNRTLTVNAGVVTFANTLSSGTGSYTLTENGSGTLVLDGTNTFGNFTLSSGTVIAANSSALGTATLSLGTGTLASTGGATSFSNAITLAGSPTFSGSNAITLTGTVTMSASETVTINNPAVTFNDVISQPGAIAFALTESGTGALILTGSVANTFTGAMTVNSGTLFLDKTAGVNAIGGALTVGNTTSAAGSAIAELQASNQTPAAAAVAVQSSGILNIQSYTDTIGALTMTGGSIIGTGTLNLGGNVTVSATGTATASVSANLNLNGNRTFTINANGVVTAVDLTVSGAIADGSAVSVLTKAGAGTLALNGSNSYSGGTTLSAGGLSLGTSNSAGTGPLSLGTAMLQSSGGSLTLNNAVTMAGNTIFGGTGALVFSGSSTLTATRTLTINNGSVTFSGPIGQSASGFGITESGTGTLEIGGTAANSFTGIVTVNGGSLLLADSAGTAMGGNLVVGSGTAPALAQWLAANQMAAAGSVTVNAGGILDLNGNNQTISGLTVGGGASITMESGTLTLNGNVTHNGTGSTPATIAGTLNLGGATRTFTIGKSTASQDLAVTAIILNGGLTKSGAGLMALDATNSYTGNTTISQGTLQLGINNAIASASAISITSGTLDMQTYTDTIGALTMTGGTIIGSGTLNLGGNVTVSTAGTTTVSISPNVTLNGNQTFTINANGVPTAMDLTVSAPIANGATTGILTKAGAGFLALNGSNSFSGGTTLNAGGLSLGTANSAGPGPLSLGTATLQSGGGRLTLSNAVTLAGNTIFGGTGALVFTGSSTLTGTRTLTINNGSVTFTGAIGQSASGFGITETGTGTLKFAGSAADSFTGAVTVNGGSLLLADSAGAAMGGNLVIGSGIAPVLAQWLAANQMAATGSVTVNAGGVLDLNGNNQTISGLTVGGGASITMKSGTLTLNGNVTHNGTGSTSATIAGALNLGGATRTFTIGKSTASQDLVVTATILNGGLTKSGAGLMALDATNSYTGNTTINQGTLQLGTNNAIASASAISITSGTLDLNSFNETVSSLSGNGAVTLESGTLTLGGTNTSTTYSGSISGSGDLVKNGTGTLSLNGINSYTGPTIVNAGNLQWLALNGAAPSSDVTVAAGAKLTVNATAESIGSLAGAGNLVLTTGTLAAGGDNATTLFSGTITGTGIFTKAGSGTLTLGGSNTFTGTTAINAGILSISNNAQLGNSSNGLSFNGGTLQATASITTSRAVSLQSAGTIDTGSNSVLVSGSISGAGPLVKLGSGTLLLSASNTYGGGTDLDVGILTAENNGTLGTGPVTFDGGDLSSNSDTLSIGDPLLFDAVAGNQITGNNSLTLTGSASGPGTATINLTNAAKKVTLNPGGINAFAPGAINITSGTLLIGGAQAIGATTNLTLNGGIFSFQGLSGAGQLMGSLTLTANSTIDFGTTSGGGDTLGFATLNTNGFTLTIDDWSGNIYNTSEFLDLGPASQDRLLFAGGLAGNNLSQVLFYNTAGKFIGTGYEVLDGISLEIVPIPEPSTAFDITALLALMGCQRWLSAWGRRRKR